jgi:Zn-dependent protease
LANVEASEQSASGLALGRVAGIEVRADVSLSIIFVLITLSIGAGVLPAWHPEWSTVLRWSTALCASILFFASILLHELSHAIVGRKRGVDVRRITLFVFGGMAHLEDEPRGWRDELWMAIAGPITSLTLGVLLILLGNGLAGSFAMDPAEPARAMAEAGPVATMMLWLGPINILLAAFNLVPGFPLDGGRVLRAGLWGMTGDLERATRIAARSGQLIAWALIALGFAMMLGARVPLLGGGIVNGLWLALIGWFLSTAAQLSYQQLFVRRALGDVASSEIMLTKIQTIDPDTSVQELIEEYILRSDQRAFPVVDGDELSGLVCLEDARRVALPARSRRTVFEIMTPARELETVSPHDGALDALRKLSRRQVDQLPVVESGELRGLIRREDIVKWISLQTEAPGAIGASSAF